MKLASKTTADRHSFGIYLSNGQKKPGLKKSFIEVMEILVCFHKTVTLIDGSEWQLYGEPEVLDKMHEKIDFVRCIVSFQVYDDGEAFAVARLFKSHVKPISAWESFYAR